MKKVLSYRKIGWGMVATSREAKGPTIHHKKQTSEKETCLRIDNQRVTAFLQIAFMDNIASLKSE